MGVLHSIPLCSRGSPGAVEPLDLDKNNNEPVVVQTSQPQTQMSAVNLPPPDATSTPRPQSSPTGLQNEQYSDSTSEDEKEPEDQQEEEEPQALSDSGLEESATEFEFSRPSPPELDEGVHEEFDDTLVLDGHEEIDLTDEDPLERPPEPTVPDERVSSSSGGQSDEEAKDDGHEVDHDAATTRKISSLLSELVGDRPAGETIRPDLVPMR